MNIEQIRKLGTINKAYRVLLPIVQEIELSMNEKTESDLSVIFLFNSISIEKTSRKEFRLSLDEAIDRAVRLAPFKGITL